MVKHTQTIVGSVFDHFVKLALKGLTSNVNVMYSSDDAFPNGCEVKIFLQPSTSRPDGPKPILAFLLS